MKFKVGDMVRIKPNGVSLCAKNNAGKISKIKHLSMNIFINRMFCLLNLSGNNDLWCDEIELLKEKSTDEKSILDCFKDNERMYYE